MHENNYKQLQTIVRAVNLIPALKHPKETVLPHEPTLQLKARDRESGEKKTKRNDNDATELSFVTC